MTNLTIFAGLDISKEYFDVHVMSNNKTLTAARFSNDQHGFVQLSRILPRDAMCVMEVTGPYYIRLAFWLHDHGFYVSVVNPLVIHRFAQMRLRRLKTDRADAALIASYAATEQPSAWQPPAQYIITLQQLDALQQRLIDERTALSNQLEAFSASGKMEKSTEKLLRKMISDNEKTLIDVEGQIQQIITAYHQQMLDKLTTIPGIARKTATVLITVTAGFSKFKNHKQLCAYVGLTPRIYESGSSVRGKSRISKLGMSRIRGLLYMCAVSAKRYNRSCKELYERLVAKGKPKKLALVAVANKLLRQAFAVATTNQPYLIQP